MRKQSRAISTTTKAIAIILAVALSRSYPVAAQLPGMELSSSPPPPAHTSVNIAVSPDGGSVAIPMPDGSVRIFNAASGAYIRSLTPDFEADTQTAAPGAEKPSDSQQTQVQYDVRLVAFSHDGSTLVSTAGDVFIWDAKSGKMLRRIPMPRNPDGAAQTLTDMCVASDGSTIGLVIDYRAILWDGSRGVKLPDVTPDIGVTAMALSPDASKVALCNDSQIVVQSTTTGRTVWSITPQSSDLPSFLQFSPDGKTLMTSGGYIVVYDASTGARLHRRVDDPRGWLGVYSPDGSRIAGLRSGRLSIFQSATMEPIYTPITAKNGLNPTYATFAQNNRVVALYGIHQSGNADNASSATSVMSAPTSAYRVVLMDVATNRTLATIDAPFFE